MHLVLVITCIPFNDDLESNIFVLFWIISHPDGRVATMTKFMLDTVSFVDDFSNMNGILVSRVVRSVLLSWFSKLLQFILIVRGHKVAVIRSTKFNW